jgi:DNA-binding NtrC family response regulator
VLDYSGPSGKAEKKGIDFDKFANLQQLYDYVERSFIENKLDKNGWNVSKTSEVIGISKSALEKKLEDLGLKKR